MSTLNNNRNNRTPKKLTGNLNKINSTDLKSLIRTLEGLVELCILTLVYYYIWRFSYRGDVNPHYFGNGKFVLTLIYFALFFVCCYASDGFQYGHRKLSEVIIAQWISVVLIDLITYLQLSLIGNKLLNFVPILILMGIDFVLTFIFSYFYTFIYHRIYTPKDMLMIYGNESAIDLKFKMDKRSDKYIISKVISYEVGFEELKEEILRHDAVIINDIPSKERNDILKFCYSHEMRTYVVPKISDIIQRGGMEINLFDTPLYLVKGKGLTPTQNFVKRLMDIFLCIIALIPGLPIMAVVAIAIKAEDHGPIFYRQERVTRNGRIFNILKFRSMIVNAEKEGKSIPSTDHDPRITKVGRIIRATRIDEFPQVLNILIGDMSWVGPRPERIEHMLKYSEEIPEFIFRTKVRGGLTGYAQIYGKYNTSPYDKLRLDLMYIENYSFFLDIKLILMTIQICFKKESTEGFDKVEELEKKRKELIKTEVEKKS